MAKNIKTIKDVMNVPATEHIMLINWDNCTCPFCGAPLRGEVVGFGRDKCMQYHTCSCPTAQAAEAHNKTKEALEKEAYLKACAEREAEEARRRREEAQKPITLTAAEMISAVTARVIPGVEPIDAYDKVCTAMVRAGYSVGDAKKRMLGYAQMCGFKVGLEKAAQELTDYVSQPQIKWETDISQKVKELCTTHGVPETITL